MKRLLWLALLASSAPAWCGDAELAGEWWTPGFAARVRIESCGDALCGRIVWLWDETVRDGADRQPLIGRRVVDHMLPTQSAHWAGGWLHDPEDGRAYKGSLQLQTPTILKVEGCIGPFCRTQVWRRADVARCPPVAAR
jgi:uncharacterized protein (DUF2147 family)